MTPEEYLKMPVEEFRRRMSCADLKVKWWENSEMITDLHKIFKYFSDKDLCVLWECFNSPELPAERRGKWPTASEKRLSVGGYGFVTMLTHWPPEHANLVVREEIVRRHLVKHTLSGTVRKAAKGRDSALKRKVVDLEAKFTELSKEVRAAKRKA